MVQFQHTESVLFGVIKGRLCIVEHGMAGLSKIRLAIEAKGIFNIFNKKKKNNSLVDIYYAWFLLPHIAIENILKVAAFY